MSGKENMNPVGAHDSVMSKLHARGDGTPHEFSGYGSNVSRLALLELNGVAPSPNVVR